MENKVPVIYTIKEGEITLPEPKEPEKFDEDQPTRVVVDDPNEIPVDDGLEKLNKQQEDVKEIKTNRLEEIIGPTYGQRFDEITKADIMDRFWLMSSAVSFANQDKGLSKEKKQLVADLEDSFIDACCMEGPSKRLFKILEKNHGSLLKMLYPTRLKRTYESINMALNRLDFEDLPDAKYIPTFFCNMAASFSWETYPKYNNFIKSVYIRSFGFKHKSGEYSHLVGFMLMALLAKYSNDLSPYDYAGMWFVVSFIKNLSVCSLVESETIQEHPELKVYADNLFQLVDHMIGLILPDVYMYDKPSDKLQTWDR